MNILILAVISLCCFPAAIAFSTPGAYERMLFYYAYLVDTQNGGTGSKIAPGCAAAMKTKGGPCNFNQFIDYINDDTNPKGLHITDDREPDVQRTAATLQANEQCKGYLYTKIRPDVSNGGATAKLFHSVGQYLEYTAGGASDSVKLGLQRAAQGISRGRQAGATEHVAQRLAAKGIQLQRRQVPIFDGATENVNIPDRPATATHNHISPKVVSKAMMEAMEGQKNHVPNIEAAKALESLLRDACA